MLILKAQYVRFFSPQDGAVSDNKKGEMDDGHLFKILNISKIKNLRRLL